MTIADLAPLIVALGGGGGIYAIVRAFRGRSAKIDDRESPVPQERGAVRSDRCVSHAELAAALAQHRAEVYGRVDAAESDCERRVQEHARHGAEQYERLATQLSGANEKAAMALGILEGLRSGQPQSRRGR